ncbi:aldo/keto reductase [Dyella humi]|uniref:Aldo/keto reductase n=1 Tax=Dyella humi TaxID=1770547 RepID=A0ABW8ILB4_9GAMM
MQLRQLGRSTLSVAPLAFGGNVFGWSVDEQRSFELLDAFVDAGFNLIDTADVYSAWVPGNRGGESETIIGKWLKRSGKRDKVLIATKVAKWVEHRGLSPMNIRQALEGSLKRLQTDHIDLYQAHEDDATVPLDETLGAFAKLIEEGKVRAIGASNYTADRFAEALKVSQEHNLPRYESLQPEYNLVSRKGYEQELEPLIRQENVGVINYYALASGFLSGKYRSEADLAKSRARGGAVKKYLTPQGLKVLATLDDIASAHKATPSQVALAWLIARPGIAAPIASATTVEQLRELVGAVNLSLMQDEISALNDATASF